MVKLGALITPHSAATIDTHPAYLRRNYRNIPMNLRNALLSSNSGLQQESVVLHNREIRDSTEDALVLLIHRIPLTLYRTAPL
jgi:hypothetical protein